MNCYQAKAGELAKQWYVIDANEAVVGRLAAQIAPILMGKHRPTYTAYIDTGDYVIVTNVDKVVFTGNKWQQKFYQRYSGHPGGQKDEQAWKLFQRHPDRILKLAIQRMMPKNKIGRHMMAKLKLYSGTVHEHQAQAPSPWRRSTAAPRPPERSTLPRRPPRRPPRATGRGASPKSSWPKPPPPPPSCSCRRPPRPTRPSCPPPWRRPRPRPIRPASKPRTKPDDAIHPARPPR